MLTPEERAEQARQARAVLQKWSGYDPAAAQEEHPGRGAGRAAAEGGRPVTHPSEAVHVVLDETAMAAAGRGNLLASRLIHRAHAEPGWYLYAAACALVEADRARPGTAEHIAALPGITVLELDLPAALAVAAHDTWAQAYTLHAAQPTPERPGGAVVATAARQAWTSQPVRVLDLTP